MESIVKAESKTDLSARLRVIEQVCEQLALGRTLTQICASKSLPDRRTLHRWQNSDPEIAQQILKARKMGAWYLFDHSLDRLRNASSQTIHVEREIAHHIRWVISKLVPEVFSDKQQSNVNVSGERIEIVWASDERLSKSIK